MIVSKKHIAVGMLTLGLITTAGAGVTAAAGEGFNGHRGGSPKIAASLLGITTDEFKTRIQNGEKPKEILEAAGISHDDIRAAHDLQQKERTAQAIADGRITQEEADAREVKRAEHKEVRTASHTAIENNDYNAWATAVAGTSIAEKIDSSNFSQFVEAQNLRESGDHEGARTIMEGLGIEKPHKGKKGGFRGERHSEREGRE